MNLSFSIQYYTAWGQDIAVELVLTHQTAKSECRIVPLDTTDGAIWKGDVQLNERELKSFAYTYVVRENGKVVRREWNMTRREFPAANLSYFFPDSWREISPSDYLYSAAYRHIMGFEAHPANKIPYFQQTLVFKVSAPQLKKGQRVALLGSQPPLGAWDTHRYLPMQPTEGHDWIISLSANALYLPFEYKYVLVDENTDSLIEWEEGENRLSPSMTIQPNQVLVIQDGEIRFPMPHWKTAGVVIPIFSLRSEHSQGVGDFADLLRLVEWASEAGMNMVQILPINDTTQTRTWADCYPYKCISIYALHPMYIDLQQLPDIHDATFMQDYEKQRLLLNQLDKIDYEAVNRLKWDYLSRLYKQEYTTLIADKEFNAFCKENEQWLVPYAAFSYLRDTFHTCDFAQWGTYATYQAEKVSNLMKEKTEELTLYLYVQYLLHTQLLHTTQQARHMGVVLKGDIPIGISAESVEAWTEPHLFNQNGQAGAPPDAFSVNGQNWGFPTYNWEAMEKEDYAWWKSRFKQMATYFDAYRIDHVLGFFRIWDIPRESVHGLLGHFAPSLPMSVEEIQAFGFSFDTSLHTAPYITQEILAYIFGNKASLVESKYLIKQADTHTYALKEAYNTQRKVQQMPIESDDDVSIEIKEGLYRLISNVLFIEDAKQKGYYHPRIIAMDDYAFASLSHSQQEAFRRIHEHYYYQRHDDFWYKEAMKKLPALVSSTSMLVCAEDLGMVPACVQPVMEQLHILSLEIQSMPKTMGRRFGKVEENPYYSVCTLFTHDMPTLRLWWEEDADRRQAYYNEVLLHDGQAPDVLPSWLAEEIVARQVYSPSMLCLLSLQDWLSIDDQLRNPQVETERINIPANANHYWRYRMHLTIEALKASTSFTQRVKDLISRGNRIN